MYQACIVLPTYNEAKNISALLGQIKNVTAPLQQWKIHILVVDDDSPDKTGEVVQAMAHDNPDIHLLQGKKEGLGKAYLRGFTWVLQHLPDIDYVFQMDADLSHNPRYIPEFLKQAEAGYDFIIGSRYVPGGNTPDWKLHRKILSFTGNLYIRIVGGMWQVHDSTSGYRCIRLSFLRTIDFNQVDTKGYAFLMTLLHQSLKKGAKLQEIPIVFTDRKQGKSKMSRTDVSEYLLTATKLRFKRY